MAKPPAPPESEPDQPQDAAPDIAELIAQLTTRLADVEGKLDHTFNRYVAKELECERLRAECDRLAGIEHAPATPPAPRVKLPPGALTDEEIAAIPEDAMVRVVNHRPTFLHGPDLVVEVKNADGERRSDNTPGRTFEAGGNNLPRREWERVKRHAVIRAWLEVRDVKTGRPWLEEGGDTSLPEGLPPPDSIGDYGVPVAVALAESETRADVLRRWQAAEKRPDVLAAIRKQLDILAGEGKLRAR